MILNVISNNKAVKLFLIVYLCISQFAYIGSLYSHPDECNESNNELEIVNADNTSTEPFLVKIDESKSFSNYHLFSKHQNFFIPIINLNFNSNFFPFFYFHKVKVESLILLNKTNPRSPPNTIS
jgi:hypothetical protein